MQKKESHENTIDKLKWLIQEMALWKNEGIISQQQSEEILGRYEQEIVSQPNSSRLVAIISILGSILVGLGVILFLAANWQGFSIPLKLGLIFGCLIMTYTLGYYFAYEKKNFIKTGKALTFLGVILFGSGLALIGQIFNINAHFPDGLLFWGIGSFLVALTTKDKNIIALTILLFAAWNITEQARFYNLNYLFLGMMLVSLKMLIFPTKARLAFLLAVLGLIIWVFLTLNLLTDSFMVSGSGLVIFLGALYTLGRLPILEKERAGFSFLIRIVSLYRIMIILYAFTFQNIHRSGDWYQLFWQQHSDFYWFYGSIVGVGLIITLINVIGLAKQKKLYLIRESQVILGLVILMVTYLVTASEIASLIPTIIYNLGYLGLVLGIIAIGIREKSQAFINSALFFFIVDIITRYFDYFFKLLDRSFFFIGGGLLLLWGGLFLEKKRRKIINELG